MKARIFRLNEFMQRVEARLILETQRQRPDHWTVLQLETARVRIKRALARTFQHAAQTTQRTASLG